MAISVDDRVELVHEFMASRMALPFVNWYVGAKSELYSDWGIPGLPTYIVVDGDGVVRGRTNDVESLVGVILDATGADAATRAELRGKGRG